MAKKSWSDLTPLQQGLVVTGGAVEFLVTTWALRDLSRRPAAEVRGPKIAWALASIVQPVGPVAYLVAGRRWAA
ncbi:MAG: PLD nuclease N-terminal domain-containing protein [Nocardioides sp.]|uniref:PLD nuclease N-terminal domain-containing protein n=1 Tax=Nocardioides sp. TaxID=35761 RepID=UPI0039E3C72A